MGTLHNSSSQHSRLVQFLDGSSKPYYQLITLHPLLPSPGGGSLDLQFNQMKAKIEKANVSAVCRMCNKAEETVFHIVSECSKMAQKGGTKVDITSWPR